MPQINRKKFSLFKRLTLIIVSALGLLLLTATLLFNYYKDDIGREVLLSINNVQNGELEFEDISFNPFVRFPKISLALNAIEYQECLGFNRIDDTVPILELEKLFFTFDLVDLIKGDINVSKILLENGKLNLVAHADSSLNLINAFYREIDTLYNDRDTLEKPLDYELNLEKISLRNVSVSYNYVPNQKYSDYKIQSLNASLNYWPDTIKCFLSSDVIIDKAMFNNGLALKNKHIHIETSLVFDRNSRRVIIEPSSFSFDRANFSTEGYIDLPDDGFIDLVVKGNDRDFSVLNLFLTSTGVKNIKQGDLYFNGTVKGRLSKGIPRMECSFGINDVKIQIPNTNHSISKLSLKGSFQSGTEKDFSGARLKVEEIKAQLPGGELDGEISLMNLCTPIFDVNFNMKSDITGFDKIFNIGLLDSLIGKLEMKAEFSGQYDPVMKHFIGEKDNSNIRCIGISFVVPGVTKIQNVDGMIRFDADTLLFENFGLEIGTSDFNINGSMTNLFYILFDVEKNIDGNLQIVSNTYDFPDFFRYDPGVANNFPYRIKDIDLKVNISTSTSQLSDFIMSPEIVFDIQQLDAEIEDFLPPVSINSGVFTLGDKDSSLNLDFVNFDIEIAGSKLLTDVVYNSPPVAPDWLSVDSKVENLKPEKTFVHWFEDSVLTSLSGKMDGSLHFNLVFSRDTIVFDKLDFVADEMVFINATDTFDLRQLNLSAKDIDYSVSTSSNILESLDCDMGLSIANLRTGKFRVDELDYDINVKKGAF